MSMKCVVVILLLSTVCVNAQWYMDEESDFDAAGGLNLGGFAAPLTMPLAAAPLAATPLLGAAPFAAKAAPLINTAQTLPIQTGSLPAQALPVQHKTLPAQQMAAVVNKNYVDKPHVQNQYIEQPIIQQRVLEQPIIQQRVLTQPIIRPIVSQPVIVPRMITQPVVQPRLVEQTFVQPRVIEQTHVQQQLIDQPVKNAPIMGAASYQTQPALMGQVTLAQQAPVLQPATIQVAAAAPVAFAGAKLAH